MSLTVEDDIADAGPGSAVLCPAGELPIERQRGARFRLALAVVMGSIVLAWLVVALPKSTFYSTDAGANYLLARRVAELGPLLTFDLPMSACGGIPLPLELTALRSHALNTFPYMFVLEHEGRFRLTYSPHFPHFSALTYKLFGLSGLLLLPLLGSLAAALAGALLAIEMSLPAASAFLILLLGTPLLFYGCVFWAHSLAAACLVASLLATVRARMGMAGILVAIAVLFRSEAAPALLLLPLAWWLSSSDPASRRKRLALYFAGAALVLLPLLAFNRMTQGSVAGSHLQQSMAASTPSGESPVARRLSRFAGNLQSYTLGNKRMSQATHTATSILLLLGLAGSVLGKGTAGRLMIVLGVSGGVLCALFALAVPGQYATGFLIVLPLALLVPAGVLAARASGDRSTLFVSLFCLLHFVGVACLAPPGGWQWGPRYLLPILPLLALVGLVGARLWPRAALTLVASSILLQVASYRDLRGQLQAQDRLVELAGDAAPIATDVWFLVWQLMPPFWDRTVAFAASPAKLGEALQQFARCGAADARFLSGSWMRPTEANSAPYREEAVRCGWHVAGEERVPFLTGDIVWVVRFTRGSPAVR